MQREPGPARELIYAVSPAASAVLTATLDAAFGVQHLRARDAASRKARSCGRWSSEPAADES